MNVLDDQVSDLDPMGDNEKAGGQTGGQTGGQIRLEELRNDFGTLEERTAIEATKNIGFLDENHTLFLKCLQDDYGISSEKLQEKFRKALAKLGIYT